MNHLLFHALKLVVTFSHSVNSNIEKDRLSMFYKAVRVGSNPSSLYLLGRKDGGYQDLGKCILYVAYIIFLTLITVLLASLRFQSMILKLSVMTGISSMLISVVLPLTDFSGSIVFFLQVPLLVFA